MIDRSKMEAYIASVRHKENRPQEIDLPGDSWDYELVKKGIELSIHTEGICIELGVRLGGSMKYIMDGIAEFCPGKVAVGVDPYGSILYEHKEGHHVRLDYTEDMKTIGLSNLYTYARFKQVPFIFINLEDAEFFKRYADGIPVYNLEKNIVNKYSFVNFDGPHAVQAILTEIDFFLPRIAKGACFCFDDVSKEDVYYDHDVIEEYLFQNNFTLIDKTDRKALYQLQ